MLYKLSHIQKHQETNLKSRCKGNDQEPIQSNPTSCPVIKMVKVNPGSSFEVPGHGHTITWYKFWQHFEVFIIPITLYQFKKDLFCLIILYDILLYFIHVDIAPGQEETTLGDIILCKQKGLITLNTGCMFKKIALLSDCMHIFS